MGGISAVSSDMRNVIMYSIDVISTACKARMKQCLAAKTIIYRDYENDDVPV